MIESALKVLRNAFRMLRNDLKFYETAGSGAAGSGAQRVKIDGDSGAAVPVVRRVLVLVSSASRAKHICNNLRFGKSGSSPVSSVSAVTVQRVESVLLPGCRCGSL